MAHIDPRKLPEMPDMMIAGPGELHEEDLEVLGRQVIAHYGDTWMQLHDQTIDRLAELLGCSDRPYLVPGSGTTCLDAAVANLFDAGDTVVVANTGFFGIRLMEVAQAHRLEVVEVAVERPGAPIDPARIRDAARGAQGVLTVHVETATGTRHPVEEIARAAHDAGCLYLVDAIASVGGEMLRVDEMALDAVVTGTQKGLEAPPGFGIVALGAAGRERVDARVEPPRSWYLDLKRWDWYRREWPWHPHPVTMPTNLLLALASSLNRILEAGLEAWVARRAELASHLRARLRDLGLDPVADEQAQANLVVAAWTDHASVILKHLLEKEQIMISGGLTPTLGKAIRIGLMGRTGTEAMIDRVATAIGEALESIAAAPEEPAP